MKNKEGQNADSGSVESFEMEMISEESDDNEEDLFVQGNKGDTSKQSLLNEKDSDELSLSKAEIRRGSPTRRRCCGPFCFVLLALKAIAVLVVLVNFLTHSNFLSWLLGVGYRPAYIGCDDLEVIPIWQSKFPKLLTEGSTRMINISGDDVLDVAFGFGTGADGYNIPDFVCDIYFRGQKPCLGGIIALDGKNGHELWRLWTAHEIFALTCQADLDGDGVIDCLAGGRAGVFLAVSMKSGSKIWDFGEHAIRSDLMSVYAAQLVEDLDSDGVQDVLAVHGGDGLSDPAHRHMYGRIILFSGRDGTLLRWMATPDRRESYYPPQVTTGVDGRQIVIYGTGGNLNNGALYAISLLDLYRKNINKTHLIYRDPNKGLITPATLVDVTGDGIDDIILATMNSNVMAFNGMDFKCIWNKTFTNFESVTTAAVGLFDEDEIPDVFLKYNYGEGFPLYQYEQSMVLSGKNGDIISSIPTDTLATQSSPITISLKGLGNDIFLHWSSNCLGNVGKKISFGFRDGTHLHEQNRADLCRAIFNGTQISRLMAVSRKFKKEGLQIYNSSHWASLEHESAVNTSWLADQFLMKHPEIEESLESNADEYSVLPYKNKNFENAIRLLEEELVREYAGEQAFINQYMTYPESNERSSDRDNSDTSGQKSYDQLLQSQKGHGFEDQQRMEPKDSKNQQLPELEITREKSQKPTNPMLSKNRINLRKKRESNQEFSYHGVHRQSATGTLAPSISSKNNTIDLILPVFWIYPPKVDVLQNDDLTCIKKKLKEVQKKMKLSEDSLDLEQLRTDIEEDCLKITDHFAKPDAVYETPSDYDPLSINMGQLIIYRFKLVCKCSRSNLSFGETCASILPYEKQGWPAYMGTFGDTISRRID